MHTVQFNSSGNSTVKVIAKPITNDASVKFQIPSRHRAAIATPQHIISNSI
jgi:hypothetical protein